MKIIEGFEEAKKALSRRGDLESGASLGERQPAVRQIIDDIRRRGDKALFEYTLKFDKARLSGLEVDKKEIKKASHVVDAKVISALEVAAGRIRGFHTAQKNSLGSGFELPGLEQIMRPLERVGVYVPGGTASYPSTVLMTVIPAWVAGVKEVVLVTPPRPDGSVSPLTLAAAGIAGVDRVFSVGGAQAIAALAYGTESIPRVDKICGPGNIYVTIAKKMMYGAVGIDGLQGPSEVLIIADGSSDPAVCAADILAQAEHDPLASAVLITISKGLVERVNREIENQIKDLPRREIAAKSLSGQSMIAVVEDMEEAITLANLYAPEHLCLMVDNPGAYLPRLTNAGCIITGEKATVVMGDYVAGPSHVLPTAGTARFSSPLNVFDFLKLTNVIHVDGASLKELGLAAETLARAEGLEAHVRAVQRRLKQ